MVFVLGKCFWRYNPGEFEGADYAVKFTINKTILSNTIMFFVVTSATGVTSALVTFHHTKNWLYRQIWFVKKSIRGVAPRFWMRATTTASFFLENMHGKHVGSGSPTIWFSIIRIFHIHMDVASGIANTSQVSVTFFIHIGCWYDIFQGNIQHHNQRLWARYSSSCWETLEKKEEKIDELSENADDLLLESDLLESILEIAISTVEHLVQMWLLEPQRRPHPLLSALLALGNALEAISEKEKADREQDERAGMKEA